MPYVNAVLLSTMLFFLMLLVFAANPFEQVGFVPPDGQGLNPLLQNYWMVIHPVMLYLGYVGMAVPFAFGMAALLSKKLDNEWVRTVRRWTLIPWMFLSAGIIMGSQWAYMELGWGGYWAWDPVENASFLPWLTGTAFLHSIIIQEQRGILKVWNMVLIWLTYFLVILGTFTTRSGIIESVHSFAESDVGLLLPGLSDPGCRLSFSVCSLRACRCSKTNSRSIPMPAARRPLWPTTGSLPALPLPRCGAPSSPCSARSSPATASAWLRPFSTRSTARSS